MTIHLRNKIQARVDQIASKLHNLFVLGEEKTIQKI